jgi:glucokinase
MYILIDIGGTKTRIACAKSLTGEITVCEKISTPEKPSTAVEEIAGVINANVSESVEAIAAGIAGSIDDQGTICHSPNLSGWQQFAFADKLGNATGVNDVYVLNDTAVGALGEAYEGAGQDHGVSAYFTVGTGVGGSRIVNGELDTTTFSFEPGHQIVEMNEFLLLGENLPQEGQIPGHLEYYLSGANMARRYDKEPPEIKDDDVWQEFEDRLVAALINVSVMWSPDVIVVGGSMIFRNEFISFAYLQKQLEKKLKIYPDVPTVQRAVLQDDAGLIGAQVYLRSNQ